MDTEFRRNFPWSLAWSPRVRPVLGWLYYQSMYVGWVWPFMFTAGAAFFTNFTPWWDPLAWRSFSDTNPVMLWLHSFTPSKDFSNHHFLNLTFEAGLCFTLAAYFSRMSGSSYWKQGILATYGAVLTWAIHEGLWWIVYWAIYDGGSLIALKHFSGLGEFITLGLLIFTPVLGLYAPKRFLLAMAGFYVAWVAVGFPITESYTGLTPLYGSLWGDGWEVGSWLYAVVVFVMLEKRGMMRWQGVVRKITLNGKGLSTP